MDRKPSPNDTNEIILNHFKALQIIIPDTSAALMAVSENVQRDKPQLHTIFTGNPSILMRMAAQILIQVSFQFAKKDQDPVDLIMNTMNKTMSEIQKQGGIKPKKIKN